MNHGLENVTLAVSLDSPFSQALVIGLKMAHHPSLGCPEANGGILFELFEKQALSFFLGVKMRKQEIQSNCLRMKPNYRGQNN